jgi:hypothetical protein
MPNFVIEPTVVRVGEGRYNVFMTCAFDQVTEGLNLGGMFFPASVLTFDPLALKVPAGLPPFQSLRYNAKFEPLLNSGSTALVDEGPLFIANTTGQVATIGYANAANLAGDLTSEGRPWASGVIPFFSPPTSPITIAMVPCAESPVVAGGQAQLCFMTYEQMAYTSSIAGSALSGQ